MSLTDRNQLQTISSKVTHRHPLIQTLLTIGVSQILFDQMSGLVLLVLNLMVGAGGLAWNWAED
tara:strand:- start:55 stop:246 length:192 start_codon:yes stop_codon:yes gene_type:complete